MQNLCLERSRQFPPVAGRQPLEVILQSDDSGLVGVAEVAFVLTRLGTRLLAGLAGLLPRLSRLLTGLHAELLESLPQVGGSLLQRFGRLGRPARLLSGLPLLRLAALSLLPFTGHRGSLAGLLARLLSLIVGELLANLIQLLCSLSHVQRPFRRQRRVAARFLTLARLLAGLLSGLAGLLLTCRLSQLARLAESLSCIGGLLSGLLWIALLQVLLGSLHRSLGLLGGVLGGLGFLSLVLLLERLKSERLGHFVQLLGQLLRLLLELLLGLLLGFPAGDWGSGHLLQLIGQLSLPLGQISSIRCQFFVRPTLALRDFPQFLGSLFAVLSGLLTSLCSGFHATSGQVLGGGLSLLRELIGRLGRFRFRSRLSFRIQGQFLGREGDPLLIAESCGESRRSGGLGLSLRRLPFSRLSRRGFTRHRLSCCRLTGFRLSCFRLTGFVHGRLCGVRIAGLSGLRSQGSLLSG